jgi:3-methylfumaryl-CoA hydratase
MSGGPERTDRDRIHPFPVRALRGLLDRDPAPVADGSLLPRGWHWLYFLTPVRASRTGPDGHEMRGDFLPAIDLPNRMWASGSLRFLEPIRVGDEVTRISRVRSVEEKTGRTGPLVFVTVEHRVLAGERTAVEEEQVLVYRERTPAAAPPVSGPGASPPLPAATWSEPFTADAVTLFRFSALTYNGHRIHYDHPYTTGVEGYPGLVVHGPLLALLLLDAAGRWAGEEAAAAPGSFRYRARNPLFAGETALLQGVRRGDALNVWAATPAGRLLMEGEFEAGGSVPLAPPRG